MLQILVTRYTVKYTLFRVFKKMLTNLERNSSELKSDKSKSYTLLDRENCNLDFNTSFVKSVKTGGVMKSRS